MSPKGGKAKLVATSPTAHDRLLLAVERLVDDASTGVLSHCDLHAGLGSTCGGATGTSTKPGSAPTSFAVATHTACRRAATGTQGEVAVSVPVSTYPRPLDPCGAVHVVAGQLPSTTAQPAPVTTPAAIGAGEDHILVSLAPSGPVGAYVARVSDTSHAVRRPVVIYLDGLP
ncbi:MAG: hypothetical protein Q8K58_04050 [Acidimicrobiales bacterium]|nr:hypothetical protein [Acidimicrobiales bacterium]